MTYPTGVALDPGRGRIYVADGAGASSQILSTRLDGSGASALSTSGATKASPSFVAIEGREDRIYWLNSQDWSPPAPHHWGLVAIDRDRRVAAPCILDRRQLDRLRWRTTSAAGR